MNTIDLFPYLCYIRIMKRSEMLIIIGDIIDGSRDNISGDVLTYDLDEKILAAMEKAGMKPPQNSTLGCRDWGMTADTFRWESE